MEERIYTKQEFNWYKSAYFMYIQLEGRRDLSPELIQCRAELYNLLNAAELSDPDCDLSIVPNLEMRIAGYKND